MIKLTHVYPTVTNKIAAVMTSDELKEASTHKSTKTQTRPALFLGLVTLTYDL